MSDTRSRWSMASAVTNVVIYKTEDQMTSRVYNGRFLLSGAPNPVRMWTCGLQETLPTGKPWNDVCND